MAGRFQRIKGRGVSVGAPRLFVFGLGVAKNGQGPSGQIRGRKPWSESGETGRGLCPARGNAVRCDDRCSALRWLMQCTAMAHAARCDLMGIAEPQARDGCGVVRLASCPLARTAEKQAGHNGRMGCKDGWKTEGSVMILPKNEVDIERTAHCKNLRTVLPSVWLCGASVCQSP